MSGSSVESSQEPYREELVNMAGAGERRRGGCCRRHPKACGGTLLIAAGVSLAVLGVALGIRSYLEQTFLDTVQQQVLLLPGTEGIKQFEKSSAPLYTKFYFFNVTNADMVVEGDHPIVTQVGPYVYREWQTRTNLTWNGNQSIVHYDLNTTYTFEPTMSHGNPETDVIVTLNIPFYVFLQKVKAAEEDLRLTLIHLIEIVIEALRAQSKEAGLFTEVVVEDLLFGYNDTFLSQLKVDIEALPDKKIRPYADEIDPFFGLENITEVETGNAVYTGKHNITEIGEYIEWDGNFEIYAKGGWGTRTAKMINGTGGYFFPPNVKRHRNLTVFITELYRSGYFSYTEDKTLYGITIYRFVLPKEELNSSNQDPGFYANGPSGVLNLTAVFEENAPVFASKPHFLDADRSYVRNVVGMDPVRSLHDSYLDIEPITGNAIRAAKRIQINLRLERYEYFEETKSIISPLMMPVFWAAEEGALTKSLAKEFKDTVYLAKYGMETAVWAGVGLGGLVFVVTSLCFVGLVVQQCRYRRREQQVNTDPEENEALLN